MSRRRFSDDDRGALSEGVAVLVSAVVGIAVAIATIWWASGFGTFYEGLFRVAPTVRGSGVGADWTTGNTMPLLDFLIALTHAADVIMGAFILLMVFIHWAAFRRLADRMQQTTRGEQGTAVATDGGSAEPDAAPGSDPGGSAGGRDSDAVGGRGSGAAGGGGRG